MLGLPKSTEISKQLPKKTIFQKFELKPAQRDKFDAEISRMVLVNAISQSTLPALQVGDSIATIYVVDVILRKQDYDPKNIILLSKLIPQKLLFALHFENWIQLAIYHTKLISSNWQEETEVSLSLLGTSTDAIWENLVRSIGGIEIEDGNTLTEQIVIDDKKMKIKEQIDILEKKCRAEKQTRRKLEFFEELQNLKKLI